MYQCYFWIINYLMLFLSVPAPVLPGDIEMNTFLVVCIMSVSASLALPLAWASCRFIRSLYGPSRDGTEERMVVGIEREFSLLAYHLSPLGILHAAARFFVFFAKK